MSPRCPLGVCDGSGWIDDEETRTVRACACRPQLVARNRAKSLSARIPRRYQNLSLDRPPISDIPDAQKRTVATYLRNLEDRLAQGRGLCFFGDVGTGKTSLAMLVSSEALRRNHTVAVYSLPRLLAEISATYDRDSGLSYLDLIDALTEVDLLHIDDLRAKVPNPWVHEQLYSIINARYENERAVLVTSDRDKDEDRDDGREQGLGFERALGGRISSRLEEMCELVPLFGRDRRRFEATDLRDRDDRGPDAAATDLRLA